MDANLSLYEDKLQFYLIVSSDESQLSSHMQVAREVYAQLYLSVAFSLVIRKQWMAFYNEFFMILQKLDGYVCATNIKIMTATECMGLTGGFTRKHVVIFDDFQGDCFETVQKTPAL